MLKSLHYYWSKVFCKFWSFPFAVLYDIIGQVQECQLPIRFCCPRLKTSVFFPFSLLLAPFHIFNIFMWKDFGHPLGFLSLLLSLFKFFFLHSMTQCPFSAFSKTYSKNTQIFQSILHPQTISKCFPEPYMIPIWWSLWISSKYFSFLLSRHKFLRLMKSSDKALHRSFISQIKNLLCFRQNFTQSYITTHSHI